MKPSRRGVSLAELLVVMIACTVLFSLTSQLLCRVMRVQIESRGHADVERNALRLSRQFRSDVYRARAVDLAAEDENNLLRLELAGGQIAEYTLLVHSIRRQLVRDGERVALESYAFPDPLRCELQELADPERLLLAISAEPYPASHEQPAASVPSNPLHLRVEAVLGRDLRFGAATASEDDSE